MGYRFKNCPEKRVMQRLFQKKAILKQSRFKINFPGNKSVILKYFLPKKAQAAIHVKIPEKVAK